jgi:hypothetical protein
MIVGIVGSLFSFLVLARAESNPAPAGRTRFLAR